MESRLRNKTLPAISANKGCHSHQQLQPSSGELVSPEGTQEGNKEYLPSSSHQTAVTPHGEPEETQDVKTQDTGPR